MKISYRPSLQKDRSEGTWAFGPLDGAGIECVDVQCFLLRCHSLWVKGQPMVFEILHPMPVTGLNTTAAPGG